MPEELQHHEPLTLSSEKLQRIADDVAKKRYIRQLDQEMGDDTPDITGLRPSEYDTEEEIRVAVWNQLPRGSSREDVDPILNQVNQLIENAGGLEAYLAAETERRAQKEAERLAQREAEQGPGATDDEVIAGPQGQETSATERPDSKARRSFGRSIINRLSGR